MQVLWSAAQIQGNRDYQEDYFAIIENSTVYYRGQQHEFDPGLFPDHYSLYVLADGMGGMGNGDLAAATTIEVVIEYFLNNLSADTDIADLLKSSALAANQEIADLVEQHPEKKGMGCTLIALLWNNANQTLQWLSIGDSLLGIFHENQWIELNEKHTWGSLYARKKAAGEAIDIAEIAGVEHALCSAVDGNSIPEIDMPPPYPVQDGDIVILASDGLEVVPKEQLSTILRSSQLALQSEQDTNTLFSEVDDLRTQLFNAIRSMNNSNQDNSTVIALGFRDLERD